MLSKDDLFKAMGNRIKKRRKELDLTQEELAEKADLSPQSISTTELGKKALRADNLYKISEVLGVSTDYLLTGKISQNDLSPLGEKLLTVSPNQLILLEEIIDHCLTLCTSSKNSEEESFP